MTTVWWLLAAALLADGRMLRNMGIGTITSNTDTNNGFSPVEIPSPSGPSAPEPMTTPSPFSTYQASWETSYSFNFVQPSFNFETNLIGNFSIENMGSNFAIIKTASPQYP